MKHFFQVLLAVFVSAILLGSCSSRNYLVIPHSVSTASSISVDDLKLQPGQYDVLQSITESASVICDYRKKIISITSGDEDFSYTFLQGKDGWTLAKFSGAAELGYFTSDYKSEVAQIPNGEEFSRRVAMARIIRAAKDYQADGVVEPVVISKVISLNSHQVEYISTVSAKLIVIKSTN